MVKLQLLVGLFSFSLLDFINMRSCTQFNTRTARVRRQVLMLDGAVRRRDEPCGNRINKHCFGDYFTPKPILRPKYRDFQLRRFHTYLVIELTFKGPQSSQTTQRANGKHALNKKLEEISLIRRGSTIGNAGEASPSSHRINLKNFATFNYVRRAQTSGHCVS
jgi:hypothetical protein